METENTLGTLHSPEIDLANERLDSLSVVHYPNHIEALKDVSEVFEFFGTRFVFDDVDSTDETLIYKILNADDKDSGYYLYIILDQLPELGNVYEMYAQIVSEDELKILESESPEEREEDPSLVIPRPSRFLRQTRRTADD